MQINELSDPSHDNNNLSQITVNVRYSFNLSSLSYNIVICIVLLKSRNIYV